MKFWKLASTAIALALSTSTFASSIQSTFDSNNELWTIFDGGSAQWVDENGQQFLKVVDTTDATMRAVAPVSFLGDLSSYANGTLSFDANLLDMTGGSFWTGNLDFGHVSLINNGVTTSYDLSPGNPAVGDWVTYSTTLTALDWGFSNESEWINFLSDITAIHVSLEAVTPFVETVGFDNFTITTVPVPPAVWLFASGLIGLSTVARRKMRA